MNTESPADDVRSDEQIVAAALAPSCEEDSDEYWSAVRILQHRMVAPLLEKMREHLLKGNERQRQFAADVIAQGRSKDKELSGQCVQLLLESLRHEESPKVLAAVCDALGHHKSPEAVGPLITLQVHQDANVRLAVVHGLSCQDDPVAISALISLSQDADHDVRNWATFGLGSMTEVDSVPIREALIKRLVETDEEILGEALVGLALRGDTRAAQPLLKAINTVHEEHREFGLLLIEAVEAVRAAAAKHPDEVWKPLLTRREELGLGNPTN